LRQDDYFSPQIVARFEIRFRVAFFVHAFVVRADPSDSGAIEKQFRTCEAGEDGDPGFFDLAAEPFHKPVE
jgi:hypothetical protein